MEGTLHVVTVRRARRRPGAHDLAGPACRVPHLVVRNTGNAALPLRLGGVDPKDQLRFDFNPSTLLVEPGTAQHARCGCGPGTGSGRGEPRTWPFQLILDEEGKDEPQIVGGAMLQEPLLPSWLGKAVLGVAAGLLALHRVVVPAAQAGRRGHRP